LDTLDAQRVATLDDNLLNLAILQLFRPGSINLQKYIAAQGGDPYWPCELYPNPKLDYGDSLHRVVLCTIYLNDGFEAGETEVLHHERNIVPNDGSALIS